MRILCVGGGSGGHVTPVAAIATEIKKLQPDAVIKFVTDKRSFRHSQQLFEPLGVAVVKVSAGKLRRYANLKLSDHLQHVFKSYLPNLVDIVKFAIGICQAYFVILKFKPEVVFIKGGYVGLPVGLAAAKMFPRLPIVLHDSDAHPGLTNRILSKYARRIGVGMPLEFSEYDKSKTEFVGVPISDCFFETGTSSKGKLIFVIGGSQGSRVINDEIARIAPTFAGRAEFVLVAGEQNTQYIEQNVKNLTVLPFVSAAEVCQYMKRAEVVITRAGATTMAEIAAVQAAAIIIPSPYLAADHQTKNAEIFHDNQAAFVVYEKDLPNGVLSEKINSLLADAKLRRQFSRNIAKFSKPKAAKRMAEIIIGVEDGKEN
jgi:UDP-N-acetylglucosamine--N-acetylmuramyl-(pentapeptide) pyrophosphoryl-undecaprenol N-acetylglucosamine transferase